MSEIPAKTDDSAYATRKLASSPWQRQRTLMGKYVRPISNRKRRCSEPAVVPTEMPTGSGTDTFRLMAQDVHNNNNNI